MTLELRRWSIAVAASLAAHALLLLQLQSTAFFHAPSRAPSPTIPERVVISLGEAFEATPPSRDTRVEAAPPKPPVAQPPRPKPVPQAKPKPKAPPKLAARHHIHAKPPAPPVVAKTESVSPPPSVPAASPVQERGVPPTTSAQSASISSTKAEPPDELTHVIQPETAAGDAAVALKSYASEARDWLEQHQQYPRRARLLGIQGTVVLKLVVDPAGHVLSYKVAESSGHRVLDQAALAMVESASPLPAPHSVHKPRLELLVPVTFRLL